jgi:putative transposase
LKGHAFKACRSSHQKGPALAAAGLWGAQMKPKREHASNNAQTYMITSSTWERRDLFRNERWARLLIDTLYHYRPSAYLLHEFVIMPGHIHALISPQTSLEKTVQFIKGGFSYRAKKELGSNMEVWQKGFQDHRIRDANDYAIHVSYIHNNPVKERFCERPEGFPYSSAHHGFELDPLPQGLKPPFGGELHGAAKAAPFQNTTEHDTPEAASFQNTIEHNTPEAASFQNAIEHDTPKAAPFQNAIEADRVRLEGKLFQSKLSNQPEDSIRSVESVSPRPKAKTA